MQIGVSIDVILLGAAMLTLTAGVLSLMLMHRPTFLEPPLFLVVSSVLYTVSVLGTVVHDAVPFTVGATMVVAGALGGIVAAYTAACKALCGCYPPRELYMGAGIMLVAQIGLADLTRDLVPIMVSSSAINGIGAAVMAVCVARASRQADAITTVALTLPFAVTALAYGMRPAIYAAAPSFETYVATTVLIAMIMAVGALVLTLGLAFLQIAQAKAAMAAARQTAEEANEAKSAFLRALSHELRTPLNAVIGFAELLRRPYGRGSEIVTPRETGDHIHGAGVHMLSIIEDLLDLSLIEARQIRLVEEPVTLDQIVNAAETLLRPMAGKRDVTLRIAPWDPVGGGDVPSVQADRRRLVQAVVNLGSNAIKFSPRGSTVTLRMGADETGTRIEVIDRGPGMTPAEIVEAQRLFGRPTATEDPSMGGAGIGLPLTRELVEAHGGMLRLHSIKGEGTTAEILLPPARTVVREEAAEAGGAAAIQPISAVG
ncbi:MAG: HAMP domain-containing sensor histidine kinase [Pseudomonadota bacterium]